VLTLLDFLNFRHSDTGDSDLLISTVTREGRAKQKRTGTDLGKVAFRNTIRELVPCSKCGLVLGVAALVRSPMSDQIHQS
jgi:hypothetical protein